MKLFILMNFRVDFYVKIWRRKRIFFFVFSSFFAILIFKKSLFWPHILCGLQHSVPTCLQVLQSASGAAVTMPPSFLSGKANLCCAKCADLGGWRGKVTAGEAWLVDQSKPLPLEPGGEAYPRLSEQTRSMLRMCESPCA